MIDADVVPAQSDLASVDGEESANGKFADGVLKCAAEEQKIGSAEAIVGIAGQHRSAVDVGAADGGREVEGHNAAAPGDRLGQESAQFYLSFEFLCGGDDGAGDSGNRLRGCGSRCRDVSARIRARAVV